MTCSNGRKHGDITCIVAGAGLRMGRTRPEHVQVASVAEHALVDAVAEMAPALVVAVGELALVA